MADAPVPQAMRHGGAGAVVLAAAAGVAHLGAGFLYLVSGLAVPFAVVAALLVWWAVLGYALLRMAGRRSWWTPAVPLIAMATWVAVLSAGSWLFDWSA